MNLAKELGARVQKDIEKWSAVAKAGRVSNPGCYATGAVALLRPLVARELVSAEWPVTINAVSGYSGGGKSMIESYDKGIAPAFELYGLGLEHKHVAELLSEAQATAEGNSMGQLFDFFALEGGGALFCARCVDALEVVLLREAAAEPIAIAV